MSAEYVRMRKATMDSIAQAIQEKEGSTEKITGAEMPDRIRAIQSGGVNYLDYAYSFKIYSLNLFGTKTVELTLPNTYTLMGAFSPVASNWTVGNIVRNETVEELIIHCPNPITHIQQMLDLNNYTADSTLRKLTLDIDFSELKNASYFCVQTKALEVIDGNPINLSKVTKISDFLRICPALREVRLTGEVKVSLDIKTATALSKETITNIVGCLSPSVSGKTLTLSQSAVDKAFETSAGANDGSTSAEWETLVAAHTNWTISLFKEV